MEPEYFIDPAYAEKIAWISSLRIYQAADEIARYCTSAYANDRKYLYLKTISAIYMAGWIMGIRAERAQRRNKKHTS